MAALAGPEETGGPGQSGWYVYGIVPADVELTADVRAVGAPPGRLVRHGVLAALASEVELARRIGTPEDLRAHAALGSRTSNGNAGLPNA
ncbi:MAG TPA: GvpL/GvpF family gas vesicle protein [Trebonia sp.]|jgi:hypothetical protein